jgi:ADP-heptose:LPS heptosyltransferase
VRRALIFKFGAIGDVIMALPAVSLLHASGTQIDWVCGSAVRSLLECYSWLNILPADDRSILKGSVAQRARSIAQMWRMIGFTRYDLCATLYYDKRYKLLAFPVNARNKIMLSRTSRDYMLIPGRSHADEYARILLASKDSHRPQSLPPVRPDKLPEDMAFSAAAGVRIGLVPGGAANLMRQQTLRRWPVQNYVELAKQLVAMKCEVVLLGGEDDRWVLPHFEGVSVSNRIGSFTLPMVIKACDQCDVVVSHDTGPLHLAGLSKAAVVGLFGPTDPGNFLPRRNDVTGIWGGLNFACRPCYDGSTFAPCEHNGCMYQIAPELVLGEVNKLLKSRCSGNSSPFQVISPEVLR